MGFPIITEPFSVHSSSPSRPSDVYTSLLVALSVLDNLIEDNDTKRQPTLRALHDSHALASLLRLGVSPE